MQKKKRVTLIISEKEERYPESYSNHKFVIEVRD